MANCWKLEHQLCCHLLFCPHAQFSQHQIYSWLTDHIGSMIRSRALLYRYVKCPASIDQNKLWNIRNNMLTDNYLRWSSVACIWHRLSTICTIVSTVLESAWITVCSYPVLESSWKIVFFLLLFFSPGKSLDSTIT